MRERAYDKHIYVFVLAHCAVAQAGFRYRGMPPLRGRVGLLVIGAGRGPSTATLKGKGPDAPCTCTCCCDDDAMLRLIATSEHGVTNGSVRASCPHTSWADYRLNTEYS